jgi:hypothetical protein
MDSLALKDIPGLPEALSKARRKQADIRESAMLNLSHNICGFTVRAMTVKDYVLLDKVGSPFISRVEPTMEDLGLFLWILSPQFLKLSNRSGWIGLLQPVAAFLYARKVNKAFGHNIPESSESAVVHCFGYIDKMFFDSPACIAKGGESCLSYLTSWFDSIQSEYHIPTEEVWGMTLPELFQRLAAIRQRHNPQSPTFNKETDAVKLWILRGLRSKEFSLDDLKGGRVIIPESFSLN